MDEPYRLRGRRSTSAVPIADGLGPSVRTFRTGDVRHAIWGVAPFVMLLAYIVWLAHHGQLLTWFNSTFSVGAVTMLFLLSIGLIARTAAAGGAEVIRVHANGLLDLRTGLAVRWDEVRSLTAQWDGTTGRVARHVLTTAAGERMAIGASIGDVHELVDEIRERIVDQKLESLRVRVADGDPVRFGAFAATADGIAAGAGKLAWSDVGSVDAEAGEVVVRTRDGERWASAALEEVPNAFLLAEVAEHAGKSGGSR
jgi:Family of unknown function (DUF6585)